MINSELTKKTIAELRELLGGGEISATELTQVYLGQINAQDDELGAYLEVFDDALEQADEADKRISTGKGGRLLGIPIAIKDNIMIKGCTCSCASKILENYHATYSSHVAELLQSEGAIILGRTNMDEFAMGSSTEHSAFQQTHNPYNLKCVPGGSSGGSAVAVAAECAPVALGSDTGGSIRQPASFCGVIGLKPTYGAVSRYGLVALGSSLDCIGPIARSIDDTELLFNIISKEDGRDATNVPAVKRYESQNKVKRVGVPWNILDMPGVASVVIENFRKSIDTLKEKGYEIVGVDLPDLEQVLAVYYIIQPAEASSNLARFDGVRYGARVEDVVLLEQYKSTRGELFGEEVKKRILVGTHVLSAGYFDAYYRRANMMREEMRAQIGKIFERVDIIATPTSPTTAFQIGEVVDPVAMYAADLFTTLANLTGVPAISVPSGSDTNNMPIGLQFMAPHFKEDALFQIGNVFLNEK